MAPIIYDTVYDVLAWFFMNYSDVLLNILGILIIIAVMIYIFLIMMGLIFAAYGIVISARILTARVLDPVPPPTLDVESGEDHKHD